MKFVCDKCNTKYSISDDKVRRKVLKIRCKNCSNIIVVRESGGLNEPDTPEPAGAPARPLERALDVALKGRRPASSGGMAGLRAGPVPVLDNPDEEAGSEPTRLSAIPDFLMEPSAAPSSDDEWYLAVDGNQFGPMPFSELCSRVKRGEAVAEAFVWRDSFDDWMEVGEVPELKPFVPRLPPPPPRGGKSGLIAVGTSSGLRKVPSPRPSGPPAPPLPPAGQYLSGVVPLPPPQAMQPAPAAPAAWARGTYPSSPALPAAPAAPVVMPVANPSGDVPMAPMQPMGLSPDLGPIAAMGVEQVAGPGGPYPAPAAMVQPAQQARKAPSTTLWLKVATIAALASLIPGLGLLAYFIFSDDRPSTREPRPIAAIPAPSQAESPPAASPDASITSFEPIEITRNAPRDVPVRHVAKAPAPKAQPQAPQGPKLTKEQDDLKRLYGSQEAPTGKVPAAVAPRPTAGPAREISESELRGMYMRNYPMLKACYDRALKRDESLADMKADVTLTIEPGGLVKSVVIKGVDNDELVSCLRTNFRHWAFRPIGETKTYRIPILFRGS